MNIENLIERATHEDLQMMAEQSLFNLPDDDALHIVLAWIRDTEHMVGEVMAQLDDTIV